MLLLVVFALVTALMAIAGLVEGFLPYGRVTWAAWWGVGSAIVVLTITIYVALLAEKAMRKLQAMGWHVDRWTLWLHYHQISERNMKYVMRREDFGVLPDFSPSRSEVGNILACIEVRRRHEKLGRIAGKAEEMVKWKDESR